MDLKFQIKKCKKDFDKILKIMNDSFQSNIFTSLKNNVIVKSFCEKNFNIIYLKKSNEYIGFLIFNMSADKDNTYLILNVEYLCISLKYQSKGLSTKLIKYLLDNINKITMQINKKIYPSIYLSAILVNPRSFSKLFDIKKTFPVCQDPKMFSNDIINKVIRLNSKFTYLTDNICFNIFSIKPDVLYEFLSIKNNSNNNSQLNYYINNVNFPIGLGFYISTITKIK